MIWPRWLMPSLCPSRTTAQAFLTWLALRPAMAGSGAVSGLTFGFGGVGLGAGFAVAFGVGLGVAFGVGFGVAVGVADGAGEAARSKLRSARNIEFRRAMSTCDARWVGVTSRAGWGCMVIPRAAAPVVVAQRTPITMRRAINVPGARRDRRCAGKSLSVSR